MSDRSFLNGVTAARRNGALAAGIFLLLVLGCTGVVSTSGGPGGSDTAGNGSGDNNPGGGGSTGGGSSGTGNNTTMDVLDMLQPGEVEPKPSFTCNQGLVEKAVGWKKLTSAQYKNTLQDLLAFALKDANAAKTLMTSLAANVNKIPEDARAQVPGHLELHETYRRLDQNVGQAYIDASMDVGMAVGAALTTSARLGTVVGACATDAMTANDATCITTFIQTFGERALRRPLTPEEVTFYRAFYGASNAIDPLAFTDLIGGFLTAPQFLYQIEHGDTAVAGRTGAFNLTPYEVAARMAYQFWDTMPDDTLWNAAKSGALATTAGYAAQLDRLVKDPRARKALESFYSDWLKVENLQPVDGSTKNATFKTFAGGNLPTTGLRQSMIDDVIAMVGYYTWDKPSGVTDLFTSNLSFSRAADLTKIYGVASWDGSSTPPNFSSGVRPGLLTRAAFLSTTNERTRPIMKGVFVRQSILCDDIPPPPPNAASAVPKDPNADATTRQQIEGLTQAAGEVCGSCHATVINPIGFATENFDSLGRSRTEEVLFNTQGTERLRLPVDTKSVPQILLGDQTESSGPADLMNLIASSGKVEACLARSYFRFTFARWEDTAIDGCVLERLRTAAGGGGSLANLLREVGAVPEFQQRSFKD